MEIVAYLGLIVFGLLYNAGVAWLHRRGYQDGYTAFLVVIGVAVTVLTVAVAGLITWDAVLVLVLAFISSGIPMILGDIARHTRSRRREADRLAGIARREIGE
jgi:hypothetical protein